MGMKVYAFEPDKVAFKELKKNIELNSFKHKPEIFNFGLSKIASKAYLYSNTNDFGKSESGLINYKNHQNTKKTEIELKNFLQEIDQIKIQNLNNKIKILKIDIEGGEFSFEKEIYDLVKLEKFYCIFSYHHMIFNKNKFKKNFYKIRTLFYQTFVEKIYPSKNIFTIANIFKSK
jgi:FkbM family methyltransferase